jgi:hypothetical protein
MSIAPKRIRSLFTRNEELRERIVTLWPASVFRDYSVILARWQVEEEELERESGIQKAEYRIQNTEGSQKSE